MSKLDKIDIAEALVELLDDAQVEGIGFTLAGSDVEEGAVLLQTWQTPGMYEESVDFMIRVTRYRQPRSATEARMDGSE
jgi:hypothetical protein